MSLKDYEK